MVKTPWLPVFLTILAGCNVYESAVQKAREALNPTAPAVVEETSTVYKIVPPPAIENDKVVQFTPKDKLLALIEQFNRSPDDSLLAITVEEFTKQKQIFGSQEDASLVTVLNGTISLVQSKNKNAIQLLVQLHGLLVGENQQFLRSILARGFDFAPTLTVNLLNKFEQDKNCSMVTVTPAEIPADESFSFLDNRLNAVAPARLVVGQSALYVPFIDTCLAQLRLALSAYTTPAPAEAPSSPDAAAAAPLTPEPTPSPQQPTP